MFNGSCEMTCHGTLGSVSYTYENHVDVHRQRRFRQLILHTANHAEILLGRAQRWSELTMRIWDYVVVGGGVVGCSIARQLKLKHPEKEVVVLEKETRVGAHTSGRNSGVIHSGINQKPGGMKARLCVRGGRLLKEFCGTNHVPMKEVGTVVLARTTQEGEVLRELERRANANGVPSVRILDPDQLKAVEPYAKAQEALLSPTGAIVDSQRLVTEVAGSAATRGVSFTYDARVRKIVDKTDYLDVETTKSHYQTKFLVNCAGLHADQVAWMMDVGLDYCIIPFRGDYYRLRPDRSYLVKSMIFPPPNLNLPFLGIHLTRKTDDSVIVGPNASLALGREKYRDAKINWQETLGMLLDLRFTRLMSDRKFLRLALKELRLSISKEEFAKAARSLVPDLRSQDLIPSQSCIRAQLIDKKGNLVEDFAYAKTDKSFHALNAVSPGMTSALAFAEEVETMILHEP